MGEALGRRFRPVPFKFKPIRRRFGNRPFRLLDVGAGNHSASLAKWWFPSCHYAGIDRERGHNNDDADFACMDEFFELDLTRLEFGAIPDDSYDVILAAHVIEHLHNGDAVLRALVPKLRSGGIIFVEFPGPRSRTLPSMKGTLNFFDDPSHVRLFTAAEVRRLLVEEGLRVLRAGTRRDPVGILLTPLNAWHTKRVLGYVPGGVFWDLLGFAEVVVAERPGTEPPPGPTRG